jgi:hypothetical protein
VTIGIVEVAPTAARLPGVNNGGIQGDEIRRQFREPLIVAVREAELDVDVFAVHIAEFGKAPDDDGLWLLGVIRGAGRQDGHYRPPLRLLGS